MNEPFGNPAAGTTIEFRCDQCGKTLRSGGAFAGKHSKCPSCGAMVQIPAASPGSAPSAKSSPTVPTSATGGGYDASPSGAAQPASPPRSPLPTQTPTPPQTPSTQSLQPPMNQPPGYNPQPGYGPASNLPPQPGYPQQGYPQQGYPQQQPAPPYPQQGGYPPQPGGYPPAPNQPGPGGWQQPQPNWSQPGGPPQGAPGGGSPAGQRTDRLPKISTESSAGGRDTAIRQIFERIMTQVRRIYVGQDELVLGSLVALFSGGHVLIESFPGLGKTLFVRTLGQTLGCKFGRIQFTADLMPSDITGSPLFDMKTQEFRFRPGPVFTQLLLADEINRAPAKAHAALLEIMQERNVTVDGLTHKLEPPFIVLATQNPIESEGTYNLPEAQLDRFMFKLIVEYPHEKEEADILKMHSQQVDVERRFRDELQTVTSPEEIIKITQECGKVRVDDRLVDYINRLVRLTRDWPQFHLGASPRAGITLMQGARTLAAFRGRDYAVPDDVVELALPALRHRVILTAEAEVEGRQVDEVLTQMIRSLEVPRL